MSYKIIQAWDVPIDKGTIIKVVTTIGDYNVYLVDRMTRGKIAKHIRENGAYGYRIRGEGEASAPFTYLTPRAILAVVFP